MREEEEGTGERAFKGKREEKAPQKTKGVENQEKAWKNEKLLRMIMMRKKKQKEKEKKKQKTKKKKKKKSDEAGKAKQDPREPISSNLSKKIPLLLALRTESKTRIQRKRKRKGKREKEVGVRMVTMTMMTMRTID